MGKFDTLIKSREPRYSNKSNSFGWELRTSAAPEYFVHMLVVLANYHVEEACGA